MCNMQKKENMEMISASCFRLTHVLKLQADLLCCLCTPRLFHKILPLFLLAFVFMAFKRIIKTKHGVGTMLRNYSIAPKAHTGPQHLFSRLLITL